MIRSADAHPLALLCRVGFEPDLIDELRAWFTARSVVVDIGSTQEAVVRVAQVSAIPRLADLVFARDLLVVDQDLTGLDTKDRVTPIGAALDRAGAFSDLALLAPDSESTKPLAPLLTALEARLRNGKSAAGNAHAAVWMLSGTHALVGHAPPGGSAPFSGGIPRLKFPRGAPSRSTLKLDEAFQVLLTEAERTALLRPGLTAVDLGAAPGGWTFQLVMRQIRVTAIDNGRVDAELMASGLVAHLREDGFRYRPAKPVDWLVCDMVEKPGRVAELVARWFASGWCRTAVFNLKLPMKRRFEAWMQARQMLQPLAASHSIRARQLYHDREEITVAVVPQNLREGALRPTRGAAAAGADKPQSRRQAPPTGGAKHPIKPQYVSDRPVRPELVEGHTSAARASTGSARTESHRTEQYRGKPGRASSARDGSPRVADKLRSRTEATPTHGAKRPSAKPKPVGGRRSRSR